MPAPRKPKGYDAKDKNPNYSGKSKPKAKAKPKYANRLTMELDRNAKLKKKNMPMTPKISPRVAEMNAAKGPKSARATEGSKGYSAPRKSGMDMNPGAYKGAKPKVGPKTGLDMNPKAYKGVQPKVKVKQANVYRVKKGDSLWAVAQKKGTTVAQLMKLNPQLRKRANSNSVVLYSGTKIRVPGVGGGAGKARVK